MVQSLHKAGLGVPRRNSISLKANKFLTCLCDNLSVLWSHYCQCMPECSGYKYKRSNSQSSQPARNAIRGIFPSFVLCCTTLLYLFCSLQNYNSPSMLWTASLGCSVDSSLFLIILSWFYFLYNFSAVKENCKVLCLCWLQVAEQYHQGLCAPGNHWSPLRLANLFV